jgi:hypothetical protein
MVLTVSKKERSEAEANERKEADGKEGVATL